MAFRIDGLKREQFDELFALDSDELIRRNARRVIADDPGSFPCRISLEDAAPGETLILTNFVSLDAPSPFRTAYAIYVREDAKRPACFVDQVPSYLNRRTLSLRAFDTAGMLKHGVLALPGEADDRIRDLFGRGEVDTIHAHSATYGCFLARIDRN